MSASFRISKQMKSSLYTTLKWDIEEGSLRGRFYLKVPNSPEHFPLRDALWRVQPPAAVSVTGPKYWQWCLPKRQFWSIWNAKTPRLD